MESKVLFRLYHAFRCREETENSYLALYYDV
jgi:hypothetical protein